MPITPRLRNAALVDAEWTVEGWSSPFSCASTQPILSLLSLPGFITLSTTDLETSVNTKQDSSYYFQRFGTQIQKYVKVDALSEFALG